MLELKSADEIARMGTTGQFVATVLAELATIAQPGVDVLALETRAREMIAEAGAVSCYWDYAPSFGRGPFRNVVCLSVNDAVLHGLPAPHTLVRGDVLTMDFAVALDGWVADAAVTTQVGYDDNVAARAQAGDRDAHLIDSTRRALAAGIAAAVPGGRLGDISAAIGAVAAADGYRVNTDFGGHGLGRTMHEDPHIPNLGRAGRGLKLRAGMTLALEPWWSTGSADIIYDPDGWTIRSADGTRTAHSEHTIAITDDGPVILTARVP